MTTNNLSEEITRELETMCTEGIRGDGWDLLDLAYKRVAERTTIISEFELIEHTAEQLFLKIYPKGNQFGLWSGQRIEDKLHYRIEASRSVRAILSHFNVVKRN